MKKVHGVCPIAPAVFHDDGSLDLEGYRRCCDAMLKGGAQALALFGIAGEYYKFDREEEEALIPVTVEVCHANDTPAVISNTRHSTESATKWAKRIEASGADCMMLLPPFFLKPGAAEITRHVEAVCDAVSIPVMFQYAPEQTGVTIPPEALANLAARHQNLNYFKIECKPPGAYISRLTELLKGKQAEIFVGNAGFQMIEGFRRGAQGVMPGPSMFDVYRKIWDALEAGNDAEAFRIHAKLNALLNHIRQNVEMIIHFEKRILQRRGLIESARCRSPQFRSDAVYDRLFDELYAALEPEFIR